jgi:hypothetical protein
MLYGRQLIDLALRFLPFPWFPVFLGKLKRDEKTNFDRGYLVFVLMPLLLEQSRIKDVKGQRSRFGRPVAIRPRLR